VSVNALHAFIRPVQRNGFEGHDFPAPAFATVR
jgi:hypothetical protein